MNEGAEIIPIRKKGSAIDRGDREIEAVRKFVWGILVAGTKKQRDTLEGALRSPDLHSVHADIIKEYMATYNMAWNRDLNHSVYQGGRKLNIEEVDHSE